MKMTRSHKHRKHRLANLQQDQPEPILKPEHLRRYTGKKLIHSEHLKSEEIVKFNNALIVIITTPILLYIMFTIAIGEENLRKQQCTTRLMDIEEIFEPLVAFICKQYCNFAAEYPKFSDITKSVVPLYKNYCSAKSIDTIASAVIGNMTNCKLLT
jgi:hypothetical protein